MIDSEELTFFMRLLIHSSMHAHEIQRLSSYLQTLCSTTHCSTDDDMWSDNHSSRYKSRN